MGKARVMYFDMLGLEAAVVIVGASEGCMGRMWRLRVWRMGGGRVVVCGVGADSVEGCGFVDSGCCAVARGFAGTG